MYYLMDLERTIGTGIVHYWRRNKYGYTPYIGEAGLFPEEEAMEIFKNDLDFKTIAIPVDTIKRILGDV